MFDVTICDFIPFRVYILAQTFTNSPLLYKFRQLTDHIYANLWNATLQICRDIVISSNNYNVEYDIIP